MRRGAWIHQYDQLGEQTVEEIAATLVPRGIGRVYVKALDGAAWMAEVYAHPLAPASAEQLAETVGRFRAAGLALVPWVVPRRSAAEAAAHLACGQAAGGLVVDYEHGYAGFWQGGLAEAGRYMDRLRAAVAAEGLWVGVAPDPRQVGRDYPAGLLGGLSAILPQAYWTDFGRPWRAVLEEADGRSRGLGPVEPILPYDAAAAELQAALAWCVGQGYGAASLWRLGAPNAAQLDAFARRAAGDAGVVEPSGDAVGAAEPAPQPAPEPAPIPATYLERGWDTWPAVAINLEGIISQVLAERDAAGAKLAAVRAALDA